MFDGNGNWISNFSAVADRNADIKILASRFDNIFIADIAESFEDCLTKDMQVKPTQNFDANNFRVIDVADPVADNDAVNLQTLNARIAAVEQDPILAFKWSDYEINDQSWLRADTFSWNDGTVYTNAYTHLYNDIQDVTSSTETIGSYTVTYYQATDGHRICLPDQETTLANIYNESGVAWYYILDTTNQRFKLPRENPIREELKDFLNAPVVGNGGPIKLTNSQNNASIGNLTQLANLGGVGYGLQSSNKASTNTVGIPTSGDSGMVADLSNSTKTSFYKGKKYLYFYVGQFSQSATEQTAGLNSELFNGKVDLNAANLSTQGKSLISGLGMPSNSYDELTLGASGSTYTAPANGYFTLRKGQSSAGQYINITINNIFISNHTASGTVSISTGFIPVKKGDILKVDYTAGGGATFLFYYAEGEPNV